MIKEISWWIKRKYRRLTNKCLMCGREPTNSEDPGPYQSNDYGRYCMKFMRHASNYGMSKSKMIEQINR